MRTAFALAAITTLGFVCSAEGRVVIDSTIDITGVSNNPEEGVTAANGSIESARRRCLSNRVVRISTIVGGERVRLDTDISSRNGYWGGEGAVAESPDQWRARLKPKRLSRRKRCSGDRDSFAIEPMRVASRRETFPSTLQYFLLAYSGDQVGGAGYIESPRDRCLARRKVRAYDYDDGVRGALRARDVSSRNGWWGALGESTSEGVNLTLLAKRLRPGRRCGGDSTSYDPDPN